jgi:ABC-2 type transport system ATP-binding protein
MICGLLRADAAASCSTASHRPGRQRRQAQDRFVPQDLALYEDLSALENLKLFGALYGLKAPLEATLRAGAGAGQACRTAPPTAVQFSGGMKRRLNIAAALLHEPLLLILDEPTVGVDPQSRNAIFDTLEALQAQGRALIYTSHYMEEVERLADHIVIIDHGKVLADETPAALYQRLPAQAALQVELAQAPSAALLSAVQALQGVTSVERNGATLNIGLAAAAQAAGWTGRAMRCCISPPPAPRWKISSSTLTGRNLRD